MAGLYVHVPFCRSPQTYDESYTVPIDNADLPAFVTALCHELRAETPPYTAQENITTLYAGGGRPSLLSLSSIHAVLTTMMEVVDASAFEEATAELHPADATPRYVRGLRHMGFDRLSLPVLSFFPNDLDALNAPHSAEDAVHALRVTRNAGIDEVSVDLLFGWTGQSRSDWRALLQLAVEMQLPHLTLIEATANGGPVADDDTRADQLEYAMTFLQSEGYEQYELTHFAHPGHRSVHQEKYYAHGNYLGLGPSAHSFWWPNRTDTRVGHRWANVSDLAEYVSLLDQNASPTAYREPLDASSLAREYILLRLRTKEGLDLNRLRTRYGVDLRSEHSALLNRLHEHGLLHTTENTIALTNQGRLLTDRIAQRLLPSP